MATSNNMDFRRITGNSNNANATSYATASVSPVSGQVIFAVIVSLKATAPDTPTASGTNGFSGTWAQIGTTQTLQTPAGNFIGVSRFWSVAASGTAGVLTFDFGVNTQLAGVWDVITSPFINVTTPVSQSQVATDTTASTALPSVTLASAFSSSMDWVVFTLAQQATSQPSVSVAGVFNPLSNATSGAAAQGVAVRLIVAPVTSITPGSGTWTANVAKIAIADELAQDGTGVATGGGLLGNEGFFGGVTQ